MDRAYRYAAVELVVNGEPRHLTPIDYVGESLLKGGPYTYGLDVVESRFTLSLHEPQGTAAEPWR